MPSTKTYDVAVIGAGVFGAWTAYSLQKSGASVVLLDAYGPASARASSGGESRIIRMGYGADEVYTRWSMHALPLWKELFAHAGRPELFQPTGVLWIAHEGEPYALTTLASLATARTQFEQLSNADLRNRYPQIVFDADSWGIFEPQSGVLMARRAVQTVVAEARRDRRGLRNRSSRRTRWRRPPRGNQDCQRQKHRCGRIRLRVRPMAAESVS